MQIETLGLGCLLVVAGLAGCGGGGSSGTFTTSVPSSTKLTDLTPSQSTQLCNDLITFDEKSVDTEICKIAGLLAAEAVGATGTTAPTNAQLQTACTQAYNECLSTDGGVATPGSCDSSTLNVSSTCTATVGDLQTCAGDEQAVVKQFYGALPSCSSLTTANLSTALASINSDAGLMDPVSCSKFDSTCDTSSTSTAHRSIMRHLQALKH
jgi:hypothetical protein